MTEENREQAMAASYTKDLMVAGIVKQIDPLGQALTEWLLKQLKGEVPPPAGKPPPMKEPESQPETEHWCKEHGCKFYKNEKNDQVWYSHKIKDGSGYCSEKKRD